MRRALIFFLIVAAPLSAQASQEVRCSLTANLVDGDPGGTKVRSGPGAPFAVIGKLPTDRTDLVTIIGAKGGWVRISKAIDQDDEVLFSKLGWVYGPLLGMTISWNPNDRQGEGGQPFSPKRAAKAGSSAASLMAPI